MKYLIRLLLMLFVLFTYSCNNGEGKTEINCDFQGGIVIEKQEYSEQYYFLTIKYKGEIHKVLPYNIDRHYNVGDTINKPCLGIHEVELKY